MIINIPDWCCIGKTIEWKTFDTDYGKARWFKEKIISFGYDGFFHQAYNCPVYYSKFSDYGNTIRECS
jgi:hypothetical protein